MIYVNCFWYTFIHDCCTLILFSLQFQFNASIWALRTKIKKRTRRWWKQKRTRIKFWGTISEVSNYKEVKNLKNYHQKAISQKEEYRLLRHLEKILFSKRLALLKVWKNINLFKILSLFCLFVFFFQLSSRMSSNR